MQISKKRCPHWISKNAWIVPHWPKSGESIELAGHFKNYFLVLSSKYWLDKSGNAIGYGLFFNYIDITNAPAPCTKGE